MSSSKLSVFRAVTVFAVLATVGACTSQRPQNEAPWLTGYTCCNLHYDGDWISDANYTDLPFIPAGTPISVLYPLKESHRAYATIGGRPFRLGLDFGRPVEGTEQWVSKIVIRDDPRINNAAWALDVRQAVAQGKVMIGMTKEQVLAAIGYPLPTKTPNLDSNVWRYWQNTTAQYDVHWANERVSLVSKASELKGGLPVMLPSKSLK